MIILVASEIPCRIHQVLTLRHLSFPISETECARFYGGGKYMVYKKNMVLTYLNLNYGSQSLKSTKCTIHFKVPYSEMGTELHGLLAAG